MEKKKEKACGALAPHCSDVDPSLPLHQHKERLINIYSKLVEFNVFMISMYTCTTFLWAFCLNK